MQTKIRWKVVIACLMSVVFLITGLVYVAQSVGRVAILESFLMLMPHKKLNGVNILAMGADVGDHALRHRSPITDRRSWLVHRRVRSLRPRARAPRRQDRRRQQDRLTAG